MEIFKTNGLQNRRITLTLVLVLIIQLEVCLGTRQIRETKERQLISCNKGTIRLECKPKTSVYVVSAAYGRSSESDYICLNNGGDVKQVCSSPNVIETTRTMCLGLQSCVIRVNEETLGTSYENDGERCFDGDNYLDISYKCIPDCPVPILGVGVISIGNNFAVNDTIEVRCVTGYRVTSQTENMVNEMRCLDSGTWSHSGVECEDVNECMEENLCDWHANCANTKGSYTCSCGKGFTGDGYSCNAFNEDRTWISDSANETFNLVSDRSCGGKIYENNGVVQTPNFPGAYPISSQCQWVIIVEPGHVIELDFMSFAMEGQVINRGCVRDKLTIYDGGDANPYKWLTTLCGDEKPASLQSRTNMMRLEFSADDDISYSGFQLQFRALDVNANCVNFNHRSHEGVIIKEGISNATVPSGGTVLLGCAEGYYNITPHTVRKCSNKQTWSDISNPCIPVSCQDPFFQPNSNLLLNGTSRDYRYGAYPLAYSCVSGFQLTQRRTVQYLITCDKFGQWSNLRDTEFPSCEVITCEITPDLIEVPYGTVSVFDPDNEPLNVEEGGVVAYMSYVSYGCNDGYRLIGDETRTCTGERKGWSGRSILCEEDNGIPGLNNFQIALIASILSGVVILIIGLALLYCCLKEKKRKQYKLEKHRSHREQAPRKRKYKSQPVSFRPRKSHDFTYSSSHMNPIQYDEYSRRMSRPKNNYPTSEYSTNPRDQTYVKQHQLPTAIHPQNGRAWYSSIDTSQSHSVAREQNGYVNSAYDGQTGYNTNPGSESSARPINYEIFRSY